jgi:hypothetical protein
MKKNIILCLLVSLSTLVGYSGQKKRNPHITQKDSIILRSIIEYESEVPDSNPNRVIAMSHGHMEDNGSIELVNIIILDHYHQLATFSLNYLFLGFKLPVFSDFPFIKPETHKIYESTLTRLFPKEYPKNKTKDILMPMNFDGMSLTLYFKNNNFLKEEWDRRRPIHHKCDTSELIHQ